MNSGNNKQKWSLFIDLKSAFDTVDHDIMLEKLRKKNVKPEIVNTVEWLYGQTAIKVGEKVCPILKGII